MDDEQKSATFKTNYPAIEDQRRFWDAHWQRWQERKILNEWTRRRAEVVLSVLRSLTLRHPKILDLGCGMGWFSEELARCGDVTGVDLSEQAVAMARTRCPQATFIAANVLADPLPSGQFDVVISQEVIAHVENQPKYVQVAADLLRPGGYLILTTANKFVLEHLGDTRFSQLPPEHIEQFLDMKGLKRLLRSHFRVIRTTTILPIGNGGALRVINSYKLNAALGLLIPRHYLEALKEGVGLGYSLLALARKKR